MLCTPPCRCPCQRRCLEPPRPRALATCTPAPRTLPIWRALAPPPARSRGGPRRMPQGGQPVTLDPWRVNIQDGSRKTEMGRRVETTGATTENDSKAPFLSRCSPRSRRRACRPCFPRRWTSPAVRAPRRVSDRQKRSGTSEDSGTLELYIYATVRRCPLVLVGFMDLLCVCFISYIL